MDIYDAERSVLVVDDDAAIRRLIARIFERSGAALSRSRRCPIRARSRGEAEISLVTCDINMPGGSGLGLVRGNSCPVSGHCGGDGERNRRSGDSG